MDILPYARKNREQDWALRVLVYIFGIYIFVSILMLAIYVIEPALRQQCAIDWSAHSLCERAALFLNQRPEIWLAGVLTPCYAAAFGVTVFALRTKRGRKGLWIICSVGIAMAAIDIAGDVYLALRAPFPIAAIDVDISIFDRVHWQDRIVEFALGYAPFAALLVMLITQRGVYIIGKN